MGNPRDEIKVIFDCDFHKVECIRSCKKGETDQSLGIFSVSPKPGAQHNKCGNRANKPKKFRCTHNKKIYIALRISRIKREGITEANHPYSGNTREILCRLLCRANKLHFVRTWSLFFSKNFCKNTEWMHRGVEECFGASISSFYKKRKGA